MAHLRLAARLPLFALMLLSAPTLAGQATALEQLLPMSLDELIAIPVITASRHVENRDQTPAHLMVFTRDQIRERRYRNLADLLEDAPGVDFMRGTKSSAYNNFSLQGHVGPNKLMVLLDGVPVGNPAGGNFPLAENFSLFMARQVEVLYGPAAALYGADAVAGVVNILTDPAGSSPAGWASLSAGNYGQQEVAFKASTRSSDQQPLALSLGGHWQRADRAPLNEVYPGLFPAVDARNFAGTVVVPAALREEYTGGIRSGSFYLNAGLGRDLTLNYYRNSFRSLTSSGDTPATARYLDDAPWLTTTDTVAGKYKFSLGAAVSAELVLDFSQQEVDPRSRYVNIYTGFESGYEYSRSRRYGIAQHFDWEINARHHLQSGFGHQHITAIEAHTLPQPYDTSKGPQEQGLSYRNTNLPLQIYDAAYDNSSAYLQMRSAWSPAWSSMAGVRIDRHSAFGTSINPRLGAVWRASPQQVVKALYGEAFRAPSPEESLSAFGAFDGSTDASGRYRGTGFRVANFALRPEKARTLSLTWDWRPRRDLNLITNVYHSRITNLITTLPSSAVTAIPGAILLNPESKANAGEQWQRGLDLIVQWHHPLGRDWSLELWGSASHVEGRIDEGDGREWDLSHVAAQKLKLGSTLRYRDRFTLTPQLYWTGDVSNGRKRDRNNPPDRLETPGYTVANLHLGWHRLAESRASLWLDITNLFDRRYYAAHGAGSRTFYNMPQQPRTWMLTFETPISGF